MPLVDSNQASLWDGGASSLYRAWDGRNGRLGYQRSEARRYIGNDADNLIVALESVGLTVGQRIALIGAGFGWVAEAFIAQGYGPMADGTANGKVCAIDTSTWIQSNKSGNATVNIVNADVNASTGRRAIRQQFGSNNAVIDWAISEDVLPILTGTGPTPGGTNEIVPFAQTLRSLATNVAHWITVGTRRFDDPQTWAGDARLNWKTLGEWKAWTTPDFVIQRGTATVL